MNYFKERKKNNMSAFSLIEIMTVVLIVAIGLVGTTQLIAQSLNAQMINEGGIVAYQLAQEGLEIVRQKRDTNWLQAVDWRDGLSNGIYCTDYISPLELRSVAGLNECPLYLNAENWYHSSPILATSTTNTGLSGFKRIVEISENDTNSILVKAIVSWDNRSQTIMYEAETLLYNWY